MGKLADKYLKTDPWEVAEEGFRPEYGRVSESIFSLANEYMGVRGYFEEGYGGDRLVGCYLNGVFERGRAEQAGNYKGLVFNTCYMVNTVDWLYTRIMTDGETLDLAESNISGFVRRLDMKNGVLTRELIWDTASGKSLKIIFTRFLSMTHPKLGCQRIVFEPLNFSGKVHIRSAMDFSPVHESCGKSMWLCQRKGIKNGIASILSKTAGSGQKLFSACSIQSVPARNLHFFEKGPMAGFDFDLNLVKGRQTGFEKMAVIHAEKNPFTNNKDVWKEGMETAGKYCTMPYDKVYEEQAGYWSEAWESSDITLEGDPENQQGIRYCIFQLHQTYHGEDPGLNIGAKGLTGEAYNGNAFWDTETYCLPFYLFNNPKAARNLLEYRYRTLPGAIARARELDCDGAFYPIATLDGSETCALWQHASLQLQASTAVAYGIWHYEKLYGDKEFLYGKGIEMLVEICRMLATRGQWGQRTGKYGFYSVMGPDEFEMMVNNNCYTNIMGKKTFEYALEVLEELSANAPERYTDTALRLSLSPREKTAWRKMAQKMYIPIDQATGIYEQHDGFFDLPHIDVNDIPITDFPLYHNWSYDRIYRNDMIKQPDVLMFMFLYNLEFTKEAKRANYEYYEPRCIHESSLSPSIHSIFASELGKHEEAFEFFKFATRMDLDNYNRNTREGLHTTSIAAAWMNIVYGFGGMRSDGSILQLNPTLPSRWKSYSFRILYHGVVIELKIERDRVAVRALNNTTVTVSIYGAERNIGTDVCIVEIPEQWRIQGKELQVN
ncbi:MAG TPA: glycosyl hydrolase family 65 protein [Clostridia bacterium]|nr:glycosyl hydrolase family 65 protein [Clostridia bacterium]